MLAAACLTWAAWAVWAAWACNAPWAGLAPAPEAPASHLQKPAGDKACGLFAIKLEAFCALPIGSKVHFEGNVDGMPDGLQPAE